MLPALFRLTAVNEAAVVKQISHHVSRGSSDATDVAKAIRTVLKGGPEPGGKETFLFDTGGHRFEQKAWYVGLVRDDAEVDRRLLANGETGDFIIRNKRKPVRRRRIWRTPEAPRSFFDESLDRHYILICKSGPDHVSHPEL